MTILQFKATENLLTCISLCRGFNDSFLWPLEELHASHGLPSVFPLLCSEDGVFLITLLRWKGLNNWEVKEVLDALPPDLQPRPDPDDQQMTNTSWYSCFIFW